MECSPPMRTNSMRTCSNSCVLEPWPDGVRRTDPGRSARISMSAQENVQVVKDFFAALRRGDRPGALALCDEDIEWIIPGQDRSEENTSELQSLMRISSAVFCLKKKTNL